MSEFLATVVRYLYDTVMLALLIGWLGLAAVFVIGIIALPFVKRAKCDTWPCPCRIETGTGSSRGRTAGAATDAVARSATAGRPNWTATSFTTYQTITAINSRTRDRSGPRSW
jgi:hypothetical protein